MKLHLVLAIITAGVGLVATSPSRAASPQDLAYQTYISQKEQLEVRPVVFRGFEGNENPDTAAKNLRQRLVYQD